MRHVTIVNWGPMDADLALLVADMEEHAARVACDLAQAQVQLLGMLLRRQAA